LLHVICRAIQYPRVHHSEIPGVLKIPGVYLVCIGLCTIRTALIINHLSIVNRPGDRWHCAIWLPRVTSIPTIKVPCYASAVHSLQHRHLSPDQELGKSPGFLHFHLLIGRGSTFLRWVSGRPGVGKARQFNGVSAKSPGFSLNF
jgi:hypothetical protein